MSKTTNFEMSQDQIDALTEGMEALQESNKTMVGQLIRIETLLSGNELDRNDKGLSGRVAKIESNLEMLKRYGWMGAGGMAVVGFVIGVIKFFWK